MTQTLLVHTVAHCTIAVPATCSYKQQYMYMTTHVQAKNIVYLYVCISMLLPCSAFVRCDVQYCLLQNIL
jgi:hypothetical protein